jgi:hypothetical protein
MLVQFSEIAILKYPILSVSEFIKERNLKVSSVAIGKAIIENRIDFTIIGGRRMILLTEKTESNYPINYAYLYKLR